MFLIIQVDFQDELSNLWLSSLRIILLALSFMMLIAFGARLIAGPGGHKKAVDYDAVTVGNLDFWIGVGIVYPTTESPAYGRCGCVYPLFASHSRRSISCLGIYSSSAAGLSEWVYRISAGMCSLQR